MLLSQPHGPETSLYASASWRLIARGLKFGRSAVILSLMTTKVDFKKKKNWELQHLGLTVCLLCTFKGVWGYLCSWHYCSVDLGFCCLRMVEHNYTAASWHINTSDKNPANKTEGNVYIICGLLWLKCVCAALVWYIDVVESALYSTLHRETQIVTSPNIKEPLNIMWGGGNKGLLREQD